MWNYRVKTTGFLVLILIFLPASVWGAGKGTSGLYSQLVARYAPVWVQEIGSEPLFDKITRLDFDGNKAGADNLTNAPLHPLPATIYGDVIAETKDTYFIFYGVFHLKDYDTPLREFFFKSASHINDFEGAMILVDKKSGNIRALETWFHNIFLQFAPTLDLAGNQTMDGKIHVEDQTHPILYVQSRGHGVRGFQKLDEKHFYEAPHQIYRLGVKATDLAKHDALLVSYTLESLQDFVKYARGPFKDGDMLTQPQDFGLGDQPLGKYISGPFVGDSSWARPKPPWSWTDRFDTLRPGAWFFHPAYVFNQHFTVQVSENYIFNLALEQIVQASNKDLNQWAALPAKSFFNDMPQGLFHKQRKTIRKFLYHLTEFLFFYLG